MGVNQGCPSCNQTINSVEELKDRRRRYN